MSEKGRQKRFQQVATAALAHQSRLTAELERRVDQPPSPGDVYGLPHGPSEELEWVVVEAVGERFFVVPCDAHPLVGRGDVVLDAEAPCGDLRLRCAESLWIPADLLATGRRSGFLREEDLMKVRWRMESGGGEILDDEDPDYESWIEGVVRPARTALLAQSMTDQSQVVLPMKRPWPPRSKRVEPRRLEHTRLASVLAASFFLSTVGLLLWVLIFHGKDSARQPVLTNLAMHELRLGDIYRGVQDIVLPESTNHLLLTLPTNGLPRAEAYALTLTDGEGRTALEVAELVPNEYDELVLAVPPRLLSGGAYALELWAVVDGERRSIARRGIRLVPSPER